MGFQDVGHLGGEFLAAVGADADGALGSGREVGMVFGEHVLALFRVHWRIDGLAAQGQVEPAGAGPLHLFQQSG